ncbi:MAG TPA: alpha/beta hydrolase [Gammaproteobacteria bacterium]|nr:alpha/beta hydrolase [Gammaproteobacteria bacterium]
MTTLTLYYATNRNHLGQNRWKPEGYGSKFSQDGIENLRFGRLTLEADQTSIEKHLNKNMKVCGKGDGVRLSGYLTECAELAKIKAYEEKLNPNVSDAHQKNIKLGSLAMFADLKADMENNSDVLVYIHGFNISWHEAVGAALALQLMLNHTEAADPEQHLVVVLFTWPSDGLTLPFTSYRSDRSEARGSGSAFGRGLLKLRDYLCALRDRPRGGTELCGQDIHLLCHSMGNYLLQHTIERIDQYTPGDALPRLFEQIFLCAPDADDDALEKPDKLGRVQELARTVSLYHNRGDMAMMVSDYTKGNPERLGASGAAHPALLHNKIQQIDCTPIVSGLADHSYYLSGFPNTDIRQSIDGLPQDDNRRRRVRNSNLANVWKMG